MNKNNIIAVSFLSFFILASQVSAATWTFYSSRLRIFSGDSALAVPVNPPSKISPMWLIYNQELSCPGFTALVDVQYKGDSFWSATGVSGFKFYTVDREVSAIQIRFRQDTRFFQDCSISAQTDAQQSSPTTEVLTFAGKFDHSGAAADYDVPLVSPFYAQRFEVLIPSFCAGVTVNKAGVIRRGTTTDAERVIGKEVIFKLDRPRVFDGITVGLRGPAGSSCEVTLYVYDMAPP